jgi:uncharacterized membrane protein YidH (DUF202 family)
LSAGVVGGFDAGVEETNSDRDLIAGLLISGSALLALGGALRVMEHAERMERAKRISKLVDGLMTSSQSTSPAPNALSDPARKA